MPAGRCSRDLGLEHPYSGGPEPALNVQTRTNLQNLLHEQRRTIDAVVQAGKLKLLAHVPALQHALYTDKVVGEELACGCGAVASSGPFCSSAKSALPCKPDMQLKPTASQRLGNQRLFAKHLSYARQFLCQSGAQTARRHWQQATYL